MTNQTFNVHLVLKSEKKNKKGLAPIFARIRANGVKIELSTNRNIEPQNWSSEKECALSKSNKELNQYLGNFKSKIYNAYTSVMGTGEGISAELLKKALFPTPQKKKYTLIETTMQHNEQFEKLIGVKYSYGSYKNYKTTLKYLIEFIPILYHKKDLPLESIDYAFCETFYLFLITEKNCHNNGANKQLQRVKKIIHYAIRSGYIVSNPMATYALDFKPAKRSALTLTELGKLESLILQRQDLEQVRDIFVFQCYTGLSYIDIKRFGEKHIQVDDKGELWIKMHRQKTDVSFSIPLLKPALRLLKIYRGVDQKDSSIFPVLSNQKMNNHLKVLQEIAGIDKNLTTHLARHSFATTITLSNNVPIETVSRMLGHTNIRTTQIYAKVLDSKIESDMADLKKSIK